MSLSGVFGGIGLAFQSRNFMIFWWGHINFGIGAWVYRLALAWLAWDLTQSTAWLGIVAAATMLPILFLCPIGGVTADRYGHRVQLIVSCAANGVTAVVLTVLAATDTLTIPGMVLWALLNGITRAFTIPSRQAMMPQIVEPRLLPAVLGFQSATYYGANFIGPAIGGFLVANYGAAAAMAYFAAGGFLASASLPFVKITPHAHAAAKRASFFADLAEGFRYTARHPGIRLMILMAGVIAVAVQPVVDMLASVADDVLFMGANGLAVLAGTFGAGAMVGGMWMAWRGRAEGSVRILLVGLAAGLGALGVFAFSGWLWLSMTALFVVGASVVTSSTAISILIQNSVEPTLRARVMSLDSMLSIGAPAVGAMLIGWAGTYFGIQVPLFAAALAGLAVVALAWRPIGRERRRLEVGVLRGGA